MQQQRTTRVVLDSTPMRSGAQPPSLSRLLARSLVLRWSPAPPLLRIADSEYEYAYEDTYGDASGQSNVATVSEADRLVQV